MPRAGHTQAMPSCAAEHSSKGGAFSSGAFPGDAFSAAYGLLQGMLEEDHAEGCLQNN